MSRDILTPTPYRFDEDFEQTVVALAVRSLSFWLAVGRELEPECMSNDLAKIILRAARMVEVSGKGVPPTAKRVKQRLTSQNEDGKISDEKLAAAKKYIDRQVNSQEFESAVIEELKPVLQRRRAQDIAMSAANEFATGNGFEKTKEIIAAYDLIGERDPEAQSDEVHVQAGDIEAQDKVTEMLGEVLMLDKFPLGIPEVDIALGGGVSRPYTTTLVGSTGDGKSKALMHIACNGLRLGYSVGLASVELTEDEIMMNVQANMSGLTTEEVLFNAQAAKKTGRPSATWKRIAELGSWKGSLHVKYFPAKRTFMSNITSWFDTECGDDLGITVLDYIDEVISPERYKVKKLDSYEEGGLVAAEFREYNKLRSVFGFTASQAQRQKNKNSLLTTESPAGSIQKSRLTDYLITLNYDPETGGIKYLLDKVRWGKGRIEIGPIPHDWGRGRMCRIGDRTGDDED